MVTFAQLKTPNGHTCGEVTSALQKAIRRGDERGALYWGAELDLAGYGAYVWKRLRIIASEDIGLAEPMACVQVRALYDNWLEQRKAEKSSPPAMSSAPLFLCHAVIVLARAKKSRLVDHALMVAYEGEREPIKVPDHALDRHTAAGRRMGRDWTHFFDEAALLRNDGDVPDPYAEEGRAVRERRTQEKSQPSR